MAQSAELTSGEVEGKVSLTTVDDGTAAALSLDRRISLALLLGVFGVYLAVPKGVLKSTGPLWGDVTLLRHHLAIMGPDWWAHGRSWVGYLLLVASAVAITSAALWARRLDATAAPEPPG